MLTRNQQIELMHEVKDELELEPAIGSRELYEKMFPGVVDFYDFDQVVQHVRSGHDIPAIPQQEEPEIPGDETEIVSTLKAVAEGLGITQKLLKEWQKEPGFPASENGYDLAAIRAWRDGLSPVSTETSQTDQTS